MRLQTRTFTSPVHVSLVCFQAPGSRTRTLRPLRPGNVQDAVLCQFMGFDVVLNVGPAAKKGANGKLKVGPGAQIPERRAPPGELICASIIDSSRNLTSWSSSYKNKIPETQLLV